MCQFSLGIRPPIVFCFVTLLATGCGGREMPPPNPGGPPLEFKTADAKELANKLLVVLANKDAEGLRALKKQVFAKMEKAMRSGVGEPDNEYGFLLGPLHVAEVSGDWASAEKNLRVIVDRSKRPVSP